MRIYLVLAVVLRFTVDLLLLLAAERLAGLAGCGKRCLLAALLGGLHAGLCLLPGFSFLESPLWQVVMLGLMGITAFGRRRGAVIATALFTLLRMALGSAALDRGNLLSVLLSALLLGLLCAVDLPDQAGQPKVVDVELCHKGKRVRLTALRDTGNGLVDPITGQSVLVADAAAARELLGIGKSQLQDPITTVASGAFAGLRLIPYRAVGCGNGMLLGIRVEQLRIGTWKGSGIVAFAPEGLGEDGGYRALTGGAV